MEIGKILELELKNNTRILEHKLKVDRRECQESKINFGVYIISEQIKANTMALFAGLDG